MLKLEVIMVYLEGHVDLESRRGKKRLSMVRDNGGAKTSSGSTGGPRLAVVSKAVLDKVSSQMSSCYDTFIQNRKRRSCGGPEPEPIVNTRYLWEIFQARRDEKWKDKSRQDGRCP